MKRNTKCGTQEKRKEDQGFSRFPEFRVFIFPYATWRLRRPLYFLASSRLCIDGAGKVLAAQNGEGMTVVLEPIDDGEREPVEHRAANKRGRGPGHHAVGYFNDGIARRAAVVEHMVGDFEETFPAGVLGWRGARHGEAGEGNHRETLLLAVEGDVDGRAVFTGIGNDDERFAGEKLILPVVALDELRAVARQIFNKATRGIHDAGDTHESTGAADDLAQNKFTVAGTKGVNDATLGDAGAQDGCQLRNDGSIGLPCTGEEVVGAGQVGFGKGRHGNRGTQEKFDSMILPDDRED